MANKYTYIFQNLKHYSIDPPKWLFKKIWAAIKKNDSVDHAAYHEEADDAIDLPEEYTEHEIEIFKSLQEYSVAPPSFVSLNINKDYTEEKKILPAVNKNVFSIRNISRIAAAVVLLLCSAWGLYHIIQSKKETEEIALQQPASTSVKNNNKDLVTNNNGNTVVAQSVAPETTDKAVAKIKSDNKKRTFAVTAASTKRNNKTTITLVDNDVLLTLVSYKYTDYMPLLKSMEKKKKIQLGQFSYINISDKMNAMLKDMYATKRNNKPTRKARRVKSQLKKWKKADEKNFDKNKNNNPVDIIDLSEFILK